jgi:hypothetical protein
MILDNAILGAERRSRKLVGFYEFPKTRHGIRKMSGSSLDRGVWLAYGSKLDHAFDAALDSAKPLSGRKKCGKGRARVGRMTVK